MTLPRTAGRLGAESSEHVTLHNIAQEAGVDFLVTEHVPGRPSDQVIRSGKIEVTQTPDYATQIAGAPVLQPIVFKLPGVQGVPTVATPYSCGRS